MVDLTSNGDLEGTSRPLEPIGPLDESATQQEARLVIKSSTIYYLAITCILLIAAYFVGWTMGTSSTANVVAAVQTSLPQSMSTALSNIVSNQNTAQQSPPTQDSNQRLIVDVDNDPMLGPKDAPVTIIEFSDFQCPFCGKFFGQIEPSLLKKYEGKIRFVYRDFPLDSIHPFARPAAEASECAHEQNKFWEYHDLLFQNQDQLTHADLLAYAKQLNLDMKVFESCISSSKYAAEVENDYQAGVALGITGTPTFFVNGRMLVGAQPLSAFSNYIDAELASLGSATALPTTKP